MTETAENKTKNCFVAALKRWLVFLGIAIAALSIVMLPYIIRGNYLVWMNRGDFADGAMQHAPFLKYMFERGLFRGLGDYDYNIGLGADYTVSFAYYMMFDPINLLLYIMPRGNFLLAYSFLIAIRFLLAAVSMYIYLRNHGIRQILSVVFAIAYMLSGYMLFTFTRHPDLTSGAIYLPLIILGLEKAIEKNNPILLMVFVFVATISSFYMIYMVTLYAVLYAVLYYINMIHARGEKVTAKGFCAAFFRTAAYYAVGLLLASFLLLPVAHGYLSASRSAGKGMVIYNGKDLASFAGSFFVPVTGTKYTPVMFNLCTLLLASAAIAVTRKNVHRTMTIIFAAGVFVPLAGYVMNLFNYASNRFLYMLSFSAFALIAEYLNGRESALPTKKEVNSMFKGVFAAALVLANFGIWAVIHLLTGKLHNAVIAVFITAAIGLVALSIFGFFKFYKIDFGREKVIELFAFKRLVICFAAVTLCCSVVFNSVYSAQFDDGKLYNSFVSASEQYVAELPEDEFVRLDTTVGKYSRMSNRPLDNGYKGTITYNTMTPGATADFLKANGVYTFSYSLGMSGLGGRTALEALLASKYYRASDGEYVPAQFRASDSAPDLYKTDCYIPFGTVFTQAMSVEQFESLPEVERQYAMLTAVVTERGERLEDYKALSTEHGDFFSRDEEFTLKRGESKIIELSDDAKYNLTEREFYVSFDLKERVKKETKFCVSGGKSLLEMCTYEKGSHLYTGQTSFLFKLDETCDSVKFENIKGDNVTFCNLRFYSAPVYEERRSDCIISRIRAAQNNPHLTDTRFDSRGFSGKINSSGGYMLIPLPYSKGWTAFADGKKLEILKADSGLMCAVLPAGEYAIEFTYKTPWLNIGVLGSLAASAAFAGIAVATVIIKIRRRKKSVN